MPAEVRGITCELTPRMSVILNMLEPMILPKANWVFFFMAAATEAASSGSEVPQAMSVREIIASLTPNDFAICTALSTKKSQLVMSTASPPTTFIVASQSGVFSSGVSSVLAVGVVLFCLSRRNEYHIKLMNIISSKAPSMRLIDAEFPLKKLKAKSIRTTETPIHRGISNFMFSLLMAMGKNRAVTPRMANTLKMFEPTTLPMATSALPFNAPIKLTTSSGIDVPMPTIAAPITKSETLNLRAIETAPATKKSAPNTMPTKEITRIIYSIVFLLFSLCICREKHF